MREQVSELGVMFPPTTIADFTIVSELGRGGMGLVYEAYDRELDRHVAIKVVRDRGAGSAAGLRLTSEAKAMARLTHPNVVAVHQVGTIDNQVYVVMELVRGDTLADWLATPRSWREIVAMFLQAGEGLLAAHRAGLIHRDFKPSNVLVDREGRARVGDFGLARSDDPAEPRFAKGSENSGVAGTPAYMAPEQQQGEAQIDARVDQFAFAVSLERALATAQGKPSRRVVAALSRARSLDRDQRFADLAELLAELRAGSRSWRRVLAIAAGGAALGGVVAAALVLSSSSSASSCEVELADQVWNPYARAAQVAGFLRTRPDSAIASASTASIVDAWVDRWKIGRKTACTLDSAPQLECLDDQLQQLASQVEQWRHADPASIDRAVRAATMLPHPLACASSPAVAIEPALRTKLTVLNAQLRAGHAREAHDGIAEMLALAERATPPNPRALATALLVAGRIERENGNATGARGLLSRATKEAGRAMDDGLLFEALLDQASVIVDLGHPREALGLLDAATALQARAGEDAAERVALHRADALGQAGLAEEAIAESMRVIPLLEERAAHDPAARIQLSTALGQLAAAQLPVAREAARLTLVRLLGFDEKLFGPDHPEVAKTVHDLGAAEIQLERLDDASQHLQRALRIATRAYGPRHPMVSTIYVTSAHLALMQQRGDDAKRLYTSARDALVGVLPEDAPQFIAIEIGLGDIARAQDNCKEALPHYTRAVKLLKQTGHRENEHAMQLTNLGYCLQDTGRLADARETLQLSINEIDRLQMARKWKSEPLAVLADMEFTAGHVARAIELEKAAIAALEGVEGSDAATMREYEQTQLATWTKRVGAK